MLGHRLRGVEKEMSQKAYNLTCPPTCHHARTASSTEPLQWMREGKLAVTTPTQSPKSR